MWAVKLCEVMTHDFETEVLWKAAHPCEEELICNAKHRGDVGGERARGTTQQPKGKQKFIHVLAPAPNPLPHSTLCTGPLTFHQRLKIALGAAEGLAYLHSFSTPIIHRDVKPANILVTDSLQAKLADFGLLKQLTEGDGEGGATRIAGTPGYVDPDYNRTRVVSSKTDVYSFGVVLLEMLTGRPAVMSEEDYHIATWAAQRVADYELDLLKDPSMEVPEDAIVEFADIALDCLKMPCTNKCIPSPHHQAAQRVADYELDLLKDPSMEVPEDAIVEFADIALDCLKMPCTRRPDMKAVAHRIDDLIQKYCTGKGEREAAPVEPVMRALVSEDVDGMEGFGGVSGCTSTESTDKSGAVSGQESGSLLGKGVEGRDSEEALGLRISGTDSMTSKGSHAEHSAIENRVHPR
ncbi:unnamed protein product [Closterium sp. Yama58-4]|nr:unnamed protein product [Closterium sp. Yama58-4]